MSIIRRHESPEEKLCKQLSRHDPYPSEGGGGVILVFTLNSTKIAQFLSESKKYILKQKKSHNPIKHRPIRLANCPRYSTRWPIESSSHLSRHLSHRRDTEQYNNLVTWCRLLGLQLHKMEPNLSPKTGQCFDTTGRRKCSPRPRCPQHATPDLEKKNSRCRTVSTIP